MKNYFTLVFLMISALFLTPVKADLPEIPSFMWVQDASSGTLTGSDPSKMTLTLQNVRDNITQFTDRPYHLASLISNDTFYFNWPLAFQSSAPNATLSYRDSTDSRPINLVMTLSNPRYSATTKSVTYSAAVITDEPQGFQSVLRSMSLPVPGSFGSASLFIDSAKIYPCDIVQMVNFNKDKQAYVGVINSLSIGGVQLVPDLRGLTNPVSPSSSLDNVVGVVSDIYYEGGQNQPINFGFVVSNENQVAILSLLDGGLSNTVVVVGFTVYYYDPVAKSYYTVFWTQSTTVNGLIAKQGDDLALVADVTPFHGIAQPLLYPVRLSVAPTPGMQQNLYIQQSINAKSVLSWGVSNF
jgi:hypothetical protein